MSEVKMINPAAMATMYINLIIIYFYILMCQGRIKCDGFSNNILQQIAIVIHGIPEN